MRIPGMEPASEGGRLKALLDHQDGSVHITSSRVAAQVLLGSDDCLLLLLLTGTFPNPQVYLCERGQLLLKFEEVFWLICRLNKLEV